MGCSSRASRQRLPTTSESSLFQRIFSGACGLDPYAGAVSDVYQDLFGEGNFTGKGIYDVDAFESALAGRVPDNAVLSHDLFEGVFARCGLISDIDLFEDFPSHIEVAASRSHRWMRGDWQLLPWILGRRRRAVPQLGRWKMLDNLPPLAVRPGRPVRLARQLVDCICSARYLAWVHPVVARPCLDAVDPLGVDAAQSRRFGQASLAGHSRRRAGGSAATRPWP